MFKNVQNKSKRKDGNVKVFNMIARIYDVNQIVKY